MDATLFLEYAWVLLVLIGLEGILAADNALVLAIMVKHLPDKERKKALFYGLAGAFIFRFLSLFAISFLVNVWQVQAIGAVYLLFIALNHIVKRFVLRKRSQKMEKAAQKTNGAGFWLTVLKVELADIAFAVDSILAAIALSLTLSPTPLPNIGELDGGQFAVVLTGGLIGVVIMRFAATYFVRVLHRRPGLETAAFLIVGWVGIKLVVFTLAHPDVAIIPHSVPESTPWKAFFWTVLVGIAVGGWFLTKNSPPGPDNPKTDRALKTEDNLL
ncbi:TerC family protein [Alteribacter aurantiacus]|uniref:TerC family protein n=1 Tax=Alteribacter aurantiacus TaxID=254410 RepID=UPI000415DD26|nr:TerC family protein [Alteribacter aurantiacus]